MLPAGHDEVAVCAVVAEDARGALSGQVAVVTGGASGIGAALARRLEAEGAAVVVLDRQSPGPGGYVVERYCHF